MTSENEIDIEDINILLERQAKEIFEEIIECCRLPGLEMMHEEAGDILPDGRTLLKEIIEKSGLDVNKPPEKALRGIP